MVLLLYTLAVHEKKRSALPEARSSIDALINNKHITNITVTFFSFPLRAFTWTHTDWGLRIILIDVCARPARNRR